MNRRFFVPAMFTTMWLIIILCTTGCTDEPPDTSAPERIEIDRGADWQSALLYIADENGPNEGWGSIRIYDNVSGFVEKTVEQTAAAAPSDMFVTPDGGSMYVASSANGAIAKFRWNGNNWIESGVTIDTPTTSISALAPGPDDKLYLAGKNPGDEGAIYMLDPSNDKTVTPVLSFSDMVISGITWSQDGSRCYIAGNGPSGSRLAVMKWPFSMKIDEVIAVPAQEVNEVVLSPDGLFVFVLAQGQIVSIDAVGMTVTGILKPSPEPDEDYYDTAFSADGKYMFVTGAAPGKDGTLYVVDISSNTVVHTVKHMGAKPGGIQRVE